MLIPRREYSRFWHRLVHDRTADSIAKTLSALPHCNVTIVPFHIDTTHIDVPVPIRERPATGARTETARSGGQGGKVKVPADDRPRRRRAARRIARPIAQVQFRQRVPVAGKVYSRAGAAVVGRRRPRAHAHRRDRRPAPIVFFGRKQLAGVKAGTPPGRRGHGRRAPRHDGDAQPGLRDPGRPPRPASNGPARVDTSDHDARLGARTRSRGRFTTSG